MGIDVSSSDISLGGNKIYSNEIYGQNLVSGSCPPTCSGGIYPSSFSAPIHIFNNVFENNSIGVFSRENQNVNITNNTIKNSDNSVYGAILLSSSSNVTISKNTIINSTNSHIMIGGGVHINISNNNLSNVSVGGSGIIVTTSADNVTISGGFIKNLFSTATNSFGIYVYSDSNATIRDLTLLGASLAGSIGIKVGSFANISNVNISDFSIGLQVNSSVASANITNISIYNASMAIQSLFNSTIYFLGNNFLYNTTSNGLDINVSNGSILTRGFNITTNFNSYELITARDVEIKPSNLSSLGLSALIPTANVTGIRISRAKILDYNGVLAGVNVTGQGTHPSVSIKFYFNSSSYSGYPSISVGRYSSSLWSVIGSTSSGSDYVSYENYSTSFNYFVPVAYEESESTSNNQEVIKIITKISVVLGNSFDSNTNKLNISVLESGSFIPVSGVSIRLYDTSDYSYVSGATDSSGIVQFSITKSGRYQAEIPSGSDYSFTPILISIELGNDITYVNNATEVISEKEETETPSNPQQTITNGGSEEKPKIIEQTKEKEYIEEPPKTEKERALEKIAEADAAIFSASKENRDVSSAKEKLSEANIFLSKGQYQEAESLAIAAVSLAKTAKPLNLQASQSGTTSVLSANLIAGFTALHLLVVFLVVFGVWFVYNKMVSKKKPKIIEEE